ncbi:unnamed protein product [Absidia cylindrospora]
MSCSESLKCIKTLIIDNYDSYTFNLLQLIHCQVTVIRNDQFTWTDFSTNILPHFNCIIISPGPGRPERESDFGICGPLLKAQLDPQQLQHHRPIFGICLGHQGIGYLLGGNVTYAPRIMHGRMSEIHCTKQLSSDDDLCYGSIFNSCSFPFWAVRYHSLVVDPSTLPSCLELTAYCEEDDADMEALKNSTFLSDENYDIETMDHRNHFLQHSSTSGTAPDAFTGKPITVMGFQHKTLPLWGVQFHPESVSTEHGQTMMDNFITETSQWMKKVHRPINTSPLDPSIQACSVSISRPVSHSGLMYTAEKPTLDTPSSSPSPPPTTASSFSLHVKRCFPGWVDSEYLVEDLLNGNTVQGLDVKSISWLDSSRKSSPYSQMSILSVDPAMTLRYSTLHRQVNIHYRSGKEASIYLQDNDTLFDYISRWMKCTGQVPIHYSANRKTMDDDDDISQPDLAFVGGLTGYFGYEMKRESMDGYVTPTQQLCQCTQHTTEAAATTTTTKRLHCCECMEEPDAAFHFVDRFWMFDHQQQQIYICGLLKEDVGTNGTDDVGPGFHNMNDLTQWMELAEKSILHTVENIRRRQRADEFITLTPNSSTCTTPIPKSSLLEQDAPVGSDLFTANVQHDAYLDSIQKCVQQIKEGESYEICLTTRFRLELPSDDDDAYGNVTDDGDLGIDNLWKLYTHHLRKNNPAPFSALLHFPGGRDLPPFGLLSSSPERFLKVGGGVAEMKPIKGTMARALQCQCPPHECDFGLYCEQLKAKEEFKRKQCLWEDVKERAENLMIVDLIRNDLAQVCDPSSVQVPKLMHVETYEKVHHLVSTVRGTLQPHINCVDALKKCFPPGSMTGAPKLRSVQLLDQLEHQKRRGVYSGCLGYLSLAGNADFNVVIRTAVATMKSSGKVELSVGGGGAITFLSDPEQEWKETLLKTKSVAPSVAEYLEQQY